MQSFFLQVTPCQDQLTAGIHVYYIEGELSSCEAVMQVKQTFQTTVISRVLLVKPTFD